MSWRSQVRTQEVAPCFPYSAPATRVGVRRGDVVVPSPSSPKSLIPPAVAHPRVNLHGTRVGRPSSKLSKPKVSLHRDGGEPIGCGPIAKLAAVVRAPAVGFLPGRQAAGVMSLANTRL